MSISFEKLVETAMSKVENITGRLACVSLTTVLNAFQTNVGEHKALKISDIIDHHKDSDTFLRDDRAVLFLLFDELGVVNAFQGIKKIVEENEITNQPLLKALGGYINDRVGNSLNPEVLKPACEASFAIMDQMQKVTNSSLDLFLISADLSNGINVLGERLKSRGVNDFHC